MVPSEGKERHVRVQDGQADEAEVQTGVLGRRAAEKDEEFLVPSQRPSIVTKSGLKELVICDIVIYQLTKLFTLNLRIGVKISNGQRRQIKLLLMEIFTNPRCQ